MRKKSVKMAYNVRQLGEVADDSRPKHANTKLTLNLKTMISNTKLYRNLAKLMLVAVLFVGCKDYPYHTVCEGSTTMIIYRSEKNDKIEYGKYKYAISDASGKGWTFISNQMYNVGDTIRISK